MIDWHKNDPVWDVERFARFSIEYNEFREYLFALVPGQTDYSKSVGTYNLISEEEYYKNEED